MFDNEREFQKWVKEHFLHAMFDVIDIIVPQDKATNGVSDLIAMTKTGIMAIELKYRKILPNNLDSPLFTHKLSKMQWQFLCNWARASRGFAFVILGIGQSNQVYVFDYNVFKDWDVIKGVAWQDRRKGKMAQNVMDLKLPLLKDRDLNRIIQYMFNPIYIKE